MKIGKFFLFDFFCETFGVYEAFFQKKTSEALLKNIGSTNLFLIVMKSVKEPLYFGYGICT